MKESENNSFSVIQTGPPINIKTPILLDDAAENSPKYKTVEYEEESIILDMGLMLTRPLELESPMKNEDLIEESLERMKKNIGNLELCTSQYIQEQTTSTIYDSPLYGDSPKDNEEFDIEIEPFCTLFSTIISFDADMMAIKPTENVRYGNGRTTSESTENVVFDISNRIRINHRPQIYPEDMSDTESLYQFSHFEPVQNEFKTVLGKDTIHQNDHEDTERKIQEPYVEEMNSKLSNI